MVQEKKEKELTMNETEKEEEITDGCGKWRLGDAQITTRGGN